MFKKLQLFTSWISPLKRFSNWVVLGIIIGLAFILAFAVIAEELIENELNLFDQTIISAVSKFESPLTTEIMKGFSTIGSAAVMITIVVIAWLLCLKYKRYLWDTVTITFVLTGVWLMNLLLKFIFHRSRPFGLRLVEATGYSFPSGHAMISLAFYGIIGYLLWNNLKSKRARYLSVTLLSLMVLIIGLSRIYLGVHYPSDVVAGFAAGGVMLILSILGLQGIQQRRH
jgi:undecaprenyl-diphosphatase